MMDIVQREQGEWTDEDTVGIDAGSVEPEWPDQELAAAWPRFWARFLDLSLLSFPIGAVVGLVFPSLFAAEVFQNKGGELLLGVILLPLVMIADACIVALWGRSIGKALAGLVVRDAYGVKPSLDVALRRNMLIYFRGYLMGVPLLILLGYVSAYNSVVSNDTTSWDDATGTYVVSIGSNIVRTTLTAVLAIGMQILVRLIPA
jgi:uncharacterized RDD family membrane protein YckC